MAERARKPAPRSTPRKPASTERRSPAGARPEKPVSRTAKPAVDASKGPAKPARPAMRGPRPGEDPRNPKVKAADKPAPRSRGTQASTGVASKPKAAPRKPRPASAEDGMERLQKILAHAGIASRRACEQLILEGHVQVNGKTITELGTRADPRRDEITVDYRPIEREAPVYILMNKPKGYITTVKDEKGRPTVMALLHGVPGRVYPVGRLDFNSEGLLLMTNDGELANRLMAPDHEIPKVYLVKVHRVPTPEQIKELSEGFRLDGRRLKPCRIEFAEKADNPWLKVTLTEGKNLQLRRMFAAIGHPVSKLRRIQFGPIADPALKPGEWRFLDPGEIAAITSF